MGHLKHEPIALLLGMFDGLHLGHRALIDVALGTGLRVAAFTFSNHPMAVVGGFSPPLLMTDAEKLGKLSKLGVSSVVMEKFDLSLAKTTALEYIEMLYSRFAPRAIVTGFNHTFGAGGKGTPETIQAASRGRYETFVVPPVMMNGEAVSSTRIRALIASGDVSGAASLLGEPYGFEGVVEHHTGIGTNIGFPTANIPVPDKLLPPYGVYAVRAKVNGLILPGVMNLGVKPTVSDAKSVTLETHLIGFDGDVYGAPLKLELLAFIRPERRFASKEDLAAQIERDKAVAVELTSR